MSRGMLAQFIFWIFGCFSNAVYAKLNFALTCVGNGQSMVLIAEHDRYPGRVLQGVDNLTAATLTTTKPTFNRSELTLAKEDEKQFFYAEIKDWANLNNEKEMFYFLNRDSLTLTKYSKFPKRFGNINLEAIYSCQLSSDAGEVHTKVEGLFKKKLEEKDAEKNKQLKMNKI